MDGLACGRVPGCTYSPHTVSGATRSQCALELAVLRVAPGRLGLHGHRSTLGAHHCNAHCILACQAVGWRFARSISALGELRLRAQLFSVATQFAGSGVAERVAYQSRQRRRSCLMRFTRALCLHGGASVQLKDHVCLMAEYNQWMGVVSARPAHASIFPSKARRKLRDPCWTF